MVAHLPNIAPRPIWQPIKALEVEYPTSQEHTDEEWRAMKVIIKKLYIDEQRKLVDTMAIMRSRYGFAATEQMYKKRFRKWNYRKRIYRTSNPGARSTSPGSSSRGGGASSGSEAEELDESERKSRAPTTPPAFTLQLPDDTVPGIPANWELECVLERCSAWSLGQLDMPGWFFDPLPLDFLKSGESSIHDSRTMYAAFDLVFDMFSYGKGNFAGLAARKLFVSLEHVLSRDHPDLLWHMLDTVYVMIERDHIRLLQMFLAHSAALCRTTLVAYHPLTSVLEALITCEFQTQEGRNQVCRLLRAAWLRNVDNLSQRIGFVGPTQLWFYEQLVWDANTSLRKDSGLMRWREPMEAAIFDLLKQSRTDDTIPESDRIRIKALQLGFFLTHAKDNAKAEEAAVQLVKCTAEVTACYAAGNFHACGRKMLASLQEDRGAWVEAEENIRGAIERRKIAHGTRFNLQVVSDMCSLIELYRRSGRSGLADCFSRHLINKVERYLTHSMSTSQLPRLPPQISS